MTALYRAQCPLASCGWRAPVTWTVMYRALSDFFDHFAEKHPNTRTPVAIVGFEQ